jgi:hypothetical protein
LKLSYATIGDSENLTGWKKKLHDKINYYQKSSKLAFCHLPGEELERLVVKNFRSLADRSLKGTIVDNWVKAVVEVNSRTLLFSILFNPGIPYEEESFLNDLFEKTNDVFLNEFKNQYFLTFLHVDTDYPHVHSLICPVDLTKTKFVYLHKDRLKRLRKSLADVLHALIIDKIEDIKRVVQKNDEKRGKGGESIERVKKRVFGNHERLDKSNIFVKKKAAGKRRRNEQESSKAPSFGLGRLGRLVKEREKK